MPCLSGESWIGTVRAFVLQRVRMLPQELMEIVWDILAAVSNSVQSFCGGGGFTIFPTRPLWHNAAPTDMRSGCG